MTSMRVPPALKAIGMKKTDMKTNVARMLLPSTSAATIWVRFAVLNRFMILF
jgi:hypothetical protein